MGRKACVPPQEAGLHYSTGHMVHCVITLGIGEWFGEISLCHGDNQVEMGSAAVTQVGHVLAAS